MAPSAPAGAPSRRGEHWLRGAHGDMRYWMAHSRHGLPLLLLHGYGGLIEHWRRVWPLLQEQHTPCAPDLYNFGYSAHLNVTPALDIWTAQTAQVIEQVLNAPAVVVGHSMGGMVAAQLAHNFPHLVRGLVLVNSMGLPPERAPSPMERALFGAVRAPILGELLAEVMTGQWAVRQSLQPAYYDNNRITPELVDIMHGPLRRRGGPQAYLAVSRAFRDMHLSFERGAVTAPTLLVWGEQDRSIPLSAAERFQRELFPDAALEVIPDAAHCPFDERPEAFASVLLPWMERL